MHLSLSRWSSTTLLLLSFTSLIGCDDGPVVGMPDGGNDVGLPIDAPIYTTPTVRSTTPASGASDVAINSSATVTFSEPMDAASIMATTFTVTTGTPEVLVPGTVLYRGTTATFWPAAQLAANTTFTATVTTAALSANAIPLAANYVWTFTTGDTRSPGTPVELGTAGDFVILAQSGISNISTSAITGDLALSPAAASFITGFALTADATNVFATSTQVTGQIFAADYAPPTPTNLTAAVGDMRLALTDAASRAPDVTELGAGNIGGLTVARGVYAWGTDLLIPNDVTLTGTATDVWVFQVAGNLTMSSGARIVLTGGALPENVFFQVTGLVDLGTTAHAEGVILCATAITLRTGASVTGRLMAGTAVTLDGSTVEAPE